MLMNRARALETLALLRADALIAAQAANVFYLTEHAPEAPFVADSAAQAVAVFAPGSSQFLTLHVSEATAIEISASERDGVPDLVLVPGLAGVYPMPPNQAETAKRVARYLEGEGLSAARLIVDDPDLADELGELLLGASVLHQEDVFRHIRAVKTADELGWMRESTAILERAYQEVIGTIAPGVSCGDLMRTFRVAMTDREAFGSHMTYGGASRPFVGCSDFSYRLEDGDVLFIDPAGSYHHYWADLGRTVVVGTAPANLEANYGVLREVHDHVIPQLRPGVLLEDVVRAAHDVAFPQLPEGFMPIIHAMGLEQYDHRRGAIHLFGPLTLEAGMVVNFETLYFELGMGTLQLEDTYHITHADPVRLDTLGPAPLYV